MSKFRDRLLKDSKIQHAALMSEQDDMAFSATDIPMLNLALSGRFEGGVSKGVTMIAGPSKSYKTLFALKLLKAWFDDNKDDPDATCIFYDTEAGGSLAYFRANGIDINKVIRKPVENIRLLKEDFINTIETITKDDNVFFLIDSVGNVASAKEVDDARSGSEKADMTRAKQLKSLMRIIFMPLDIRNVPCVCINHTYASQEMYSKQVVSGGTGIYYNSNTIFVISRAQEKERKSDTEISGYKFTINIEKSRFVKEKSKFPISVSFKDGIDKYSGLFDLAMDMGYVEKATPQTYIRTCLVGNPELTDDIEPEKTFKEKNTHCDEFWLPIFEFTNFKKEAENKYLLVGDDVLEASEDEVE